MAPLLRCPSVLQPRLNLSTEKLRSLHQPARPSLRSALAVTEGHWLGSFLLSLLWFGAAAWLRPLAIPDEGRYAGVAREMALSGNWLVPTLNGAPFFHKPPLFYWITAASMQAFGMHPETSRAASILAAALLTTCLLACLRRWVDPERARWAVIVLASMPLFYGGAQYANLDMLVAACIGGAVLLAAQASIQREAMQPHRAALASAFAAAALGVLAKGLIGAVLPALVLLIWGLVTRRALSTLKLIAWWPGVLLFFGLSAPWFIAVQARFPSFAHYFFVVQHIERFASTGFNNPQPIWFYPAALVALTLPWSPWLLALARAGCWRRPDPLHVRALMWIWLAVVVVFFSIPKSKLVGYILPALPPLAFLISDAMVAMVDIRRQWQQRAERVAERVGRIRARRIGAALAMAICVGVVVAAHFWQPKSMQDLAERLRAERHSGEPVVYLGNFYYDVPFYAQLDAPVDVVDAWLPAEMAKDSWRRELADATGFAPAGSPSRLLRPEGLEQRLCASSGTWLIGPRAASSRDQALGSVAPVYENDRVALWHVEPASKARGAGLSCPAAAAAPLTAPH